MGTLALAMEQVAELAQNERPLQSALAFVASRSKDSARRLPSPASEVFSGIAGAFDQLLLDVIEARTANDLRRVLSVSFPKYAAITVALGGFARAVVPPQELTRLTRESICETEADFREKALDAFGAALREQLLFTIWTTRKIHELLLQISGAGVNPSRAKEDAEYSGNFTVHMMRANFSVECFKIALRLNRPIYPDLMEELKDGLRSMVNAYAWARRGAAVRIPSTDPLPETAITDAEDEYLLDASMQDMALLEEDETPLDGD